MTKSQNVIPSNLASLHGGEEQLREKALGIHLEATRRDVRVFSELAGHPTMKSARMMRPQKDGDAVISPFMEATALEAVISEMGRLAVQVGEQIDVFFPADWALGWPSHLAFAQHKRDWLSTFYPAARHESP
jgi:hypothetical protein